jgi:hypothetical protein
MNESTTASTWSGPTLTLESLKVMLKKLQGVPAAKWVLVAPDGRCFTGENPLQVAIMATHGVEVRAELFEPFSLFGKAPWRAGDFMP